MDDIRKPAQLLMDTDPLPPDDHLPNERTPREKGARPPEGGAIDTPQDLIDEASDESFPASDPPSFTGTTTD